MTRPPAAEALTSVLHGFFQLHPDEAARLLEGFSVDEVVRLLEAAPASHAVAVFDRLTPEFAARVLVQMDDDPARTILAGLDPARAALLLLRLDEEARAKKLSGLPPGAAAEIEAMLRYPADSAGALIDPRAITFRPEATVAQVIVRLRALGRKRVNEVFLVDGEGRLTGAVPLQDVTLADDDERLEDLARGVPVSVQAVASREEVVEQLDKSKLTSLPVVDVEGRLVGVIRHETLVDAVEEEASADIQSMVGASKQERALSKVSFAVRKRLPWLHINLATAFLAAAVVGLFEATIAKFTALAVLLPVVAGQSGNTGAQALAVTMRGLALREIRLRHWARVAFKEASVGILNGCAIALVTSLGVYLWSGSSGLSFVIGSAMVASMAIAGVAGAAIPMLLSALGQDPAQSSSIVLTTVTDVTGFFSFLGLATLFAAML